MVVGLWSCMRNANNYTPIVCCPYIPMHGETLFFYIYIIYTLSPTFFSKISTHKIQSVTSCYKSFVQPCYAHPATNIIFDLQISVHFKQILCYLPSGGHLVLIGTSVFLSKNNLSKLTKPNY